jgi:ATP-dependent helicase HepA
LSKSEEYIPGQRWASETQPELGLGLIIRAHAGRVTVHFPVAGETLTYAVGSAPLRRIVFTKGDTLRTHDGRTITVDGAREENGLTFYDGAHGSCGESELDAHVGFNRPEARLFAAEVDANRIFDLRYRAQVAAGLMKRRTTRGLMGGRIDLIPHQLFIVDEVSRRYAPRVLLADEVGLGKTIEACLILHRMLLTGRAARVLVLAPESLVHQWFVELLRRFQLRFSIYDADRCEAIEESPEGGNPFLDEQWVLAGLDWLAGDPERSAEAAEAGWDLVIVDEAHHLEWRDGKGSAAYEAVEAIARTSPGLLLLTATPQQLGRQGHFARLRLLDPDRYDALDAYLKESESYGEVSALADKLLGGKRLMAKDKKRLGELLGEHVDGEKEEIAARLVDLHGTGRVMFRNLRRNLGGFPERKVHLEWLEAAEGGEEGAKLVWLEEFLRVEPERKVLVICHSRERAEGIEASLRERIEVKSAVFHEGLTLIQRDRNVAWFAEEDGARLLVCSEIGSEGRNFQFAQHLVLFDLPAEPGLLEQRIGRLDRIGQKGTIHIHVPCVRGTGEEGWARWYHEGANAFEACLHGGNALQREFGERLAALPEGDIVRLIGDTRKFKVKLDKELESGRDHLLEMSSFNRVKAEAIVSSIEETESASELEQLMVELFDHFGVALEELHGGAYFLRPDNVFAGDAFPGMKADGMSVTFSRAEALSREDYGFFSWDHPMVEASIELLSSSGQGNCSFLMAQTGEGPGINLECVFMLEAMAPRALHIDRFLSPVPMRIRFDHRARKVSDEDFEALLSIAEDGDPRWLREKHESIKGIVTSLVSKAEDMIGKRSGRVRREAQEAMEALLTGEIERLTILKEQGHPIRADEFEAARAEQEALREHIAAAPIRLDAVRLVVVE